MPKIVVTDKLAEVIKMLRMQNGIKSKALAQHLNKTPGYISKLEKQEVKNIELDTVESIFSFILGEDYQKTEIWEQIYASLQIKYSKSEIDEEIWFSNFDTVYRYIPIPETIIDYFNDKIISLNISREYLLQKINANEALSEEEINDESIKPNVWYTASNDGRASIKMCISENILSDILDKKMPSSPYVIIFCILYYLLKIEKYGSIVKIENTQIKQLNQEVKSILNSYKFYSIAERENIVSQAQSKEEIHNLLSSFDNDNAKLIGEILNELKFASDMDIRVTNDRLTGFLKNLRTDVWFTLRLISLDYHLLESVDISQRKEFLNDVNDLIKKYADTQKAIKSTETY